MERDHLLAAVDAAFVVTGADTPPWPDPWPDRDVPDAAYSVVSDPAKWRYAGARAAAWSATLVELGLAVRADADPASLRQRPGIHVDAASWLRPTRPGCEPLLVRGIEAIDGLATCVELGLGDPAEGYLETDCQCDACDWGSASLAEMIDDAFVDVVLGDVVVLVHGGARAVCRPRQETGFGWTRGQPRHPDFETSSADAAAVLSGRPVSTDYDRIVRSRPWAVNP
ncbi:DUF6226 family protein [Nocardioides acrostichi]|uniref:Uncharacterized protein n=1 Tax=Nocardioides acrostichi TaxID=2784339 RepID=A0A930V3M4_9ACTN|nr:DUF6226 family protein [Nocardioides acrostichi]MBF4163394.1 hypothetical protein [Nocardioides acrostichi]